MNADPTVLAQIDQAARSGDMARAVELAQAALRQGMVHPLPLAVVAQAAWNFGRFDDAIGFLREAISLSPQDPALPARLGHCLDLARRPEEAETAFDKALALAPTFAPALEGKARLLRGLGRVAEAEALLSAALAAEPGRLSALMGLAALKADAGDWEGSTALARQALATQPDFPDAIWELSRAAVAKREFAEAETLLKRLLAIPGDGPLKSWALLMLGDALDGLGRQPEAFDAWTKGKAGLRALYAEPAAGRQSETERMEEITAWLASTSIAPPTANDEKGIAGHLFLTGFPRSGTTLLEQILAAHPAVATLEERPTLGEAAAELLASEEGRDRLVRLDEAQATTWRKRYWGVVSLSGVVRTDRVFVDKQPAGAPLLPLFARLFPAGKVLFAIRDPRDVVLSCLGRTFQMNAFTYDLTTLEGAARSYDAAMRLAEVCRTRLDVPWLDLRMEDLIGDFEGRSRALCDFLGLEWSASLLDFAEVAKRRQVLTPSAVQVRSGLSSAGVGRWRDYRTQLAPVLPILEPWVARYGYEPD